MKEELSKYLEQNKTDEFKDLLFSIIDKKQYKDSDVYKKARIDRKTFSKIRCLDHYIPCKNNIIKLCLSLSLDIEGTKELLNSAGYQLSTNNNLDLIVSFFIKKNIFDIDLINTYLYALEGTIL